MYKNEHINVLSLMALVLCAVTASGCSLFREDVPSSNDTNTQSASVTAAPAPTHQPPLDSDEGWQKVGSKKAAEHLPTSTITITTALLAKDLKTIEPASEQFRDSIHLKNVDDLGQSNYLSFIDTSVLVDQTIIVFADDSMTLDSNGKRRVEQLARQFKRDDFFRVVGCSHGPTKIENGNEVLAENRAKRVSQELFFLGVPISNVLPEGCWSSTKADEDHPGRGVVLALYRTLADDLASAK